MKRSLLLFVSSFLFSICIVSAKNSTVALTKVTETSPTHSRAPGLNKVTVSATLNDAGLVIDFENAMSLATITISNEAGEIVYQETTNSQLIIPVYGWDSENYTLNINYSGNTLIGNFEM